MNTLTMSNDVEKHDRFLHNYGYNIIVESENVTRITKKQPLSRSIVLIVFFSGLAIAILGFVIGEYRLILLALLMMLFPLLNKGWKYPAAIVVDQNEGFLTIEKGVLFKSYKLYNFDDIDEISVHRIKKDTDVNPFEDGSKESVYVYSLLKDGKSYQLIRFATRKNIDHNAKVFSNFLNSLLTNPSPAI